MIFNPLYFSETGSSKMLVAKPGKLSNNKYLFSDIVKVVMNSEREQKKLLETDLQEIVKNQLPSIAGIENSSTQIKCTELSEKDNEKVKLDLADILPPDIAHLLVSENVVLNQDQIISYISKEPLSGELENFINNLVGQDVIKENLTENTGLFLHLEDIKSAVNIELSKEADTKQTGEKVIVQTLVVPEKSKLMSLFSNKENPAMSNSSEKAVFDFPANNFVNEIQNSDQESFKPTLSVFSFKNEEQTSKPLIGENKDNLKFQLINSNLVASIKNDYSIKIPLEKISFVPSEQKVSNTEVNNSTGDSKFISLISNLNSTVEKTPENDFSVSKITIVKKQDNLVDEVIQKNKNSENRITPDLRKINMSEIYKSDKVEFRLLKNILNNSEAGLKLTAINSNVNLNKSTELKDELFSKSNLRVINNNSTAENSKAASANSENQKSEKTINDSAIYKSNLIKNISLNNQETKPGKETNRLFEPAKQELSEVKSILNTSEKNEIKTDPSIDKKLQINNKIEVISDNKTEIKAYNKAEIKAENKTISKDQSGEIKSIVNESVLNEENKNVKEIKNTSAKVVIPELEKIKETKSDLKILKTEINADKQVDNVKNIKNEKSENKIALDENKIEMPKNTKTEKLEVKESKPIDELRKPELKTNDEKVIIKNQYESQRNVHNKNVKDENITVRKNDEKVIEVKPTELKSESKIYAFEKNDQKDVKITVKNENSEVKKSVVDNVNEIVIKDKTEAVKKEENNVTEKASKLYGLPIEEKQKLSVKVKSGIKNVSDKNEEISTVKSNKVESEKVETKEDTKHNLSESFKQSSANSEKIINKVHHEANFDSLIKDELKKDFELTNKSSLEYETLKAHKAVKSTEIIKELSKFISNQEKGSLTFDIKPESLGKMKITLSTVENALKASIEVDNEQAKTLVEKNLDKLHEELSKTGIQLNSLNISLGQPKNNKGEKRSVSKNNSNENQYETENIEYNEDKKSKSLGYNTYEYIA
ncbi:MAG: flagellar hook-length control protein FliK [Ignavibacteriales bacterium]|nr:flagellar hook-length control protein FliK [Ignavibacteriales bacterium]